MGNADLEASVDSTTTLEDNETHRSPWYRQTNPLRWKAAPPFPQEPLGCPEYKASFWSRLTFQWMTPLMVTGYKRNLDENDIWAINPDRAAEHLISKTKANFQNRLSMGKGRPLGLALLDTFRYEFCMGGLCCLLYSVIQTLNPFLLRYLIQFASDRHSARHNDDRKTPSIGYGIGFGVAVVVLQCLQSICFNHFLYFGTMFGGESRATLTGMIYEKSMVVSSRAMAGHSAEVKQKEDDGDQESIIHAEMHNRADQERPKAKRKKKETRKERDDEKNHGWGDGRIVNLMSIDTFRVDQACALVHLAWATPLSCCITLTLLLINLTYSALAGCALLAVGVVLLTKAVSSLLHRRQSINAITNERLSLTQEMIQSVRFLKYFGWETPFSNIFSKLRDREILGVQKMLALRNLIFAASACLPVFASMISFILYSGVGNALSPSKIFSSLGLFLGLAIPMEMLPTIWGQAADALVSLDKIERFLTDEESEETSVYKEDSKWAFELQNASFTWEKGQKRPIHDGGQSDATKAQAAATAITGEDAQKKEWLTKPFRLENLDFQAERKELIAVIGSVGSGKSSLLSALAGEMRKTSGELILGATRAFCPQTPWIQETSLRDNITFGKDFDADLYVKVVEACALQPDFDMLLNGDLTETGERGIALSGGQKQRLHMARAIYFNAAIVLMDDPLSAVDPHVGRHIFDKVMLGLLRDKCCILATHQTWVLSRCDRIVWMDSGQVRAVGTFQHLFQEDEAFRALVESVSEQEAESQTRLGGKEDEEQKNPHPHPHQEEDGSLQQETVIPAKERHPEDTLKMMRDEERVHGRVPWIVYKAYIQASGTLLVAPLVLFATILGQGTGIITNLWLSFWTADRFGLSKATYMGIYVVLGTTEAILIFNYAQLISYFCTKSSKFLLKLAMERVMRAPVSFFDSTPIGRITNRFSVDIDYMDNFLPSSLLQFLINLLTIVGTSVLIIAYYWYFVFAVVPLALCYILAAIYYCASARQLKSFEAVLRSHLFARFSEGLSGLSCIKAYGLQDHFVGQVHASLDRMNSAYYLTFANQRWVSIRMDLLASLLVLTVIILVLAADLSVDPSTVGLVLSYSLTVAQELQFSVRRLAEVENGMNAVQRLHYFATQVEQEAPLHTVQLNSNWPARGEIVFNKVDMRYRKDMPLILKGLSMQIRGGERLAVVGRTGAGKSSMITALFRFVELSGGSIEVDRVNISTIGLSDLRSRLTIIPQDPTLLNGTIRSNLDPFGERTDLELCNALSQAGLIRHEEEKEPKGATSTLVSSAAENEKEEMEQETRFQLNSVIKHGGSNFSLGQRQLMAFARALVRRSQIVVCDEATSSVDVDTDARIQQTMATAFRGKTLICIAHRLYTVIGFDRICVMDAGRVAQLDTPEALFLQDKGIFRAMCDRSGIALSDIRAAKDRVDESVR